MYIIDPGEGFLACGYEGKGRLEEPENIVQIIIEDLLKHCPLTGKKALVTAGPTHEAIDAVRFIGNHSTGLMGISIAETLAEKLTAHSCTITKKVGEEEKLFGSVTSADIEAALKRDGFDISRKDIVLPEHIKALGVYTVPVKIHTGVEAHLKVWVVKE